MKIAPSSRRPGVLGVLGVAFVALLGACCSDDGGSASSWNAGRAAAASGEASVAGTVLDAATGEPVPNVKVEGPRDTSSRSDAKGRFRLKGLQPGDQGEVKAETSDGRRARLVLRKLAAGELEVVLHLARVPER
jgi:hypothetical protein